MIVCKAKNVGHITNVSPTPSHPHSSHPHTLTPSHPHRLWSP